MTEKTKYKHEFIMCGHPEIYPTKWEEKKPKPMRTIGSCPIHNYTCPLCGYGAGQYSSCGCPERRY